MSTATTGLRPEDVRTLCTRAARNAGADDRVAELLADAAVGAEARGRPALGVLHLFDALDALRRGSVDGRVRPVVDRSAAAVVVADARGGIAQTAFADVTDELVAVADRYGVAAFSQRGAWTCGELGWFVDRLARRGLVALAAANSPALMAVNGSVSAVLGTNPLAFAAPRQEGPPLVVAQATSSTAYVNVRGAAREGKQLPPGTAVDPAGVETTDPEVALTGALLPFGGIKGGNLALIVEVLATLCGARWSLDAPAFDDGDRNPAVGLFVLALQPDAFAPDLPDRLGTHLRGLQQHGMTLPGAASAEALRERGSALRLPDVVLARLRTEAGSAAPDRINDVAADAP